VCLISNPSPDSFVGPALPWISLSPNPRRAGPFCVGGLAEWLERQRVAPDDVGSYVNQLRQGAGGGRGPAGLPGIDRGGLICPQAAI
jgi:hypothetical protein